MSYFKCSSMAFDTPIFPVIRSQGPFDIGGLAVRLRTRVHPMIDRYVVQTLPRLTNPNFEHRATVELGKEFRLK